MAMPPIQSSPYQPTSGQLLLLIENSFAMSHIWSDVRDQYLVHLDKNPSIANTATPITVSVLENFPSQDLGPNPSPQQYNSCYDGLRDVQFNMNPDNRISVGRINSSIDFLDGFKFPGQPTALHLVIVATTAPSDDSTGTVGPGNDYSPWIFLAQKMAEKHIHCHIVVSAQNDTGSLTMLFEETLRLQSNLEQQLPPPLEQPTKMLLRLSTKPHQQPYCDTVSANQYSPQRLPLPRRSSYPTPPEGFYSEGYDSASAPAPNEGDPPPSLVSQLQQVHGLTKKKVYGVKPTRAPFFRDELPRDKFRKAPTPLTMPLPVVDQMSSPTAGGKAISQSRADRMARVGQGSPTELHARRQHGWPRRGSRLSTPEPENITWSANSPSTYHDVSPGSSYVSSVSSDISSPVTPVTTMDDIYRIPKGIASTTLISIHGMTPVMAGYQTGGMPEPGWPQQQQQQQSPYADIYNNIAPSYFPHVTPPQQFYSTNGDFAHKNDMHVQPLEQVPQASVSSSSYKSYMMDTTTRSSVPTHDGTSRTAIPKRPASEEDEERFTFSQDFVAATAALFDAEVLPAYPNYPGMSSGLSMRAGTVQTLQSSSMPPAQPGELYATRIRSNYPNPPMASTMSSVPPPHAASMYGTVPGGMGMRGSYGNPYPNYNTSAYPPTYNSSLTGWAG